MNIRAVDFVMIPVANLANSVAFYRDVLNLRLEILSSEYQWAELSAGNLTLALKGGSSATPEGGMRLALSVENLAAAAAELRAKGLSVPATPQDHGVCQHLELRDPDGHCIILHHRTDGTFG